VADAACEGFARSQAWCQQRLWKEKKKKGKIGGHSKPKYYFLVKKNNCPIIKKCFTYQQWNRVVIDSKNIICF
jgi:hypothetical protein